MSENNPEDPELIVDTDWKSQVEKEKQTVSDPQSTDAEVATDAAATTDAATTDAADDDPTRELPPASLAMLISTFYSQAMMALGVMENPSTGQKETDLMMAKHFIDTLEMLQTKTEGNTDEDENKMFDEVLHLLRMAFVGAKKS